MERGNVKLVRLVERFIHRNSLNDEFPHDYQRDLQAPHSYDAPEKRLQRFHQILEERPVPSDLDVLSLIGRPSVAFTLQYLDRRLRLSFDDNPLIILAKLLLRLDQETVLNLWGLLQDASRYGEPSPVNGKQPRYMQMHAYTVAACDTIQQLLAPHIPNRVQSTEMQIVAALGRTNRSIADLVNRPPTLRQLLVLHQAAQRRILSRVAEDWPPAWLEYDAITPDDVIILSHALGNVLLDYVESISDFETTREYLHSLELPDEYADVLIDGDDDDPLRNIPDECMVEIQVREDEYESFLFSSPQAAQAFSWFISDRQRYALFLGIESSLFYDPLLARTAYELYKVMLEEYASALPPNTFPVYLNLARALASAPVPEEWLNGGLSMLTIEHVGAMETNNLAVVLANDEQIFWPNHAVLAFAPLPVNCYIVAPDNAEEPPVALILTTADAPGNPEHHRKQTKLTLSNSEGVTLLILRDLPTGTVTPHLKQLDRLSEKYLDNLSSSTGKFTKSRRSYFLNLVDSSGSYSGPVTVHSISGGYMIQFDQRYSFAPNQMQYT